MPTNFPTALDTFADKKVIDLEDALEAVEAKLGINGSAVATSVDKKLADLRIDVDSSVKVTGAQTVAGVKTFSSAPVVPDASFAIAKTSGLQTALDAKAADSAVVKLTGAQTVAGVKTWSGDAVFSAALDHDGTTTGFNGATPVGKRTLGAAATDAATTQTLANNLRQALIDLGLGQT